jgi:hypothetical protein
MRSRILTVLVGALLLAMPAYAENTVPTAQVQEKLIKTSLLTFNDANLTGNYAVMHAKLAKPFRDKFSPDQLKKAFKKLHRPENRPRAYRSEAAGRHHRNEDRRPRRAAAARLF